MYSCTDLVTWVGKAAYPTIEEYAIEANLRGCCRRMPDLPEWVRLGETRVFLVHEGDQKKADRGVLFGYYTLNRIQIISPEPFFEDDNPADWVPVWLEPKHPPETIVRKQFRRWVAEERYVVLRRRREVRKSEFDELLEELWKELAKELMKKGIKKTLDYVPLRLLEDEPGRGCGARTLGGPYFMDDKAAEWFDWWLEFILDLPSLFEEEEVVGKVVKERKIARDLEETEYHVHYPGEKGMLPARRFRNRLGISPSGRVCNYCRPQGWSPRSRGLILFEEPYPIYHRPPTALFRGFDRVDGDALLMKISMGHLVH
jgi:hypothetical protein